MDMESCREKDPQNDDKRKIMMSGNAYALALKLIQDVWKIVKIFLSFWSEKELNLNY